MLIAGTACRAGRYTHSTALVKTPSGKCLHFQEVEEGGVAVKQERGKSDGMDLSIFHSAMQ